MTRTAAFPGGRSKSVAITERVEADLRSRIFAGELHPKERIVAGDIAKRLYVNRGTVREALLRLESYEMVVSIPAYGTFIRDISPQEIDLIFRMQAAAKNCEERFFIADRRCTARFGGLRISPCCSAPSVL